jgi:tRNA nucleotidyltransferase (CCA-adding enzyme)
MKSAKADFTYYDILTAKSISNRRSDKAVCMKRPQPGIPDIVRTILKTLESSGFEAYIVGGAVRDMVMAREAVDWDVVTSASARDVGDLFPHLTRFSLQHGTLTLVHEGRHYEVSTFRGPSPTLEDDLAHRDFTINAMAYHPNEGRMIDPYGGRKDVERRLVRAVGAPEDRFREDPLRLMRAVRIRCELEFGIHRKTRDAMSRMAPLLESVAKERIRDELTKILTSEKPSRGLHDLGRTGLLKQIAPELMEGHRKRSRGKTIYEHLMETVDRVHPHPVLRLAALFHDIAEPRAKEGHELEGARIAEEVMRRLRFSERMTSQVAHLVRHHREAVKYDSSWDESAVRRLARGVGAEHLEPFFFLCRADLASQGKDTRLLSELEERVRSNVKTGFPHKVHDLKVDGRKVMEICGIKGGPEVGRVLEALLEEVLDHPDWNTEEKLMERLRAMSKDR